MSSHQLIKARGVFHSKPVTKMSPHSIVTSKINCSRFSPLHDSWSVVAPTTQQYTVQEQQNPISKSTISWTDKSENCQPCSVQTNLSTIIHSTSTGQSHSSTLDGLNGVVMYNPCSEHSSPPSTGFLSTSSMKRRLGTLPCTPLSPDLGQQGSAISFVLTFTVLTKQCHYF